MLRIGSASFLLSLPLLFAAADDVHAAKGHAVAGRTPEPGTLALQPRVPMPRAVQRQPEQSAEVPATRQAGWNGFELIRKAMLENPQGLTADDVAREARQDAPSLAAKDAELAEIDSSISSTIARFAPGVSLVAQYSRLSDAAIDFDFGGGDGGYMVVSQTEGPLTHDGSCATPGPTCPVTDAQGLPVFAVPAAEPPDIAIPLNSFTLQATVTLPITDYLFRMKPALVGSRAERRAAELRKLGEHEQLELQARVAFYEFVRIVARQVVAQDTLHRVEARLADARNSLEAGMATRAEVSRLEGRLEVTRDSVAQLASARRQAEIGMAILMGREVGSFEVGEDVLAPLPPDPRLRSPIELIERALAQRPVMRSFAKSKIALREGQRASRSFYFPRINVNGDFTYANPNQRFFPASQEWNYSWMVGAGISWQLGQMLNGRAEVERYEAQILALDANRRTMMRALRSEIHRTWENVQLARTQIAAQERIIRSVLPAYEQTVALFQAGEATTTDVIVAEGERLDASLQLVDAHINLRVATTQLLHASGYNNVKDPGAETKDSRRR